MVGLLSALEPRHEHPNIIIFDELDEVNEVIFFHKGCLDLGFEINRVKHYVVRIKDDLLIGAYNLSTNKRTKNKKTKNKRKRAKNNITNNSTNDSTNPASEPSHNVFCM